MQLERDSRAVAEKSIVRIVVCRITESKEKEESDDLTKDQMVDFEGGRLWCKIQGGEASTEE